MNLIFTILIAFGNVDMLNSYSRTFKQIDFDCFEISYLFFWDSIFIFHYCLGYYFFSYYLFYFLLLFWDLILFPFRPILCIGINRCFRIYFRDFYHFYQ